MENRELSWEERRERDRRREDRKRKELRAKLAEITKHLDGWALDEQALCADGKPINWHSLVGPRGLSISCGVEYNAKDRISFSAQGWPYYVNAEDRVQTVDSSNLWNPKESRPSTTARADRPAVDIAKQIQSRLIQDYERIYDRCEEVARERRKGAAEDVQAIDRLFEATRERRDPERPEVKPCFVQDMEGSTLRVEYRSRGSVKLDLDAEEAAAVIEFIRERRASA